MLWQGSSGEGISEKRPLCAAPALLAEPLLPPSLPVDPRLLSPSEVSIPALAALPCACAFAGRTQVPSIPNSVGDNIRALFVQPLRRRGWGVKALCSPLLWVS